jgi:hypothetical protein
VVVVHHIRTSLHFLRPTVSELHLLSIHGGNNGAVGWSVATATDGAQVAWGPQTGYQEWILQPI